MTTISFSGCLRSYYAQACGQFALAGLLSACGASPPKALLSPAQRVITQQVQRAVDDFVVRHQTDTVDFTRLNQFAWDSVYVFGGYTAPVYLTTGWDWIDWSAVTVDGDVPEHMNRFIFIRGHRAVGYLDLSNKLVHEVHYFTYFRDERGYLHPEKGNLVYSHFMPGNCFAKKEARFILVCPTDIPKGDSTEYVFAPAAYFQGKQSLLRQSMEDVALNLHPVVGCGYPNCWANTKHSVAIPRLGEGARLRK